MLGDQEVDEATLVERLAAQFAFSRSALSKAMDIIPFQERYPINGHVYIAALSLHVRACRKFHQIILLCQEGQADGADALCRTLFEIFLWQAFVCRQSVKVRKPVARTPTSPAHNKLTREFRANLFLANDLIQDVETHKKMSRVPGHARHAKAFFNANRERIDQTREVVGEEWWTERLSKGTFAGTIYQMAEALGKKAVRWYRVIYAHQSNQVHPSDHTRFAWYDGDTPRFRWHDDEGQISRALWAANGAFGLAVNEVRHLLDKNHERYRTFRVFENDFSEMKRAFGHIQ